MKRCSHLHHEYSRCIMSTHDALGGAVDHQGSILGQPGPPGTIFGGILCSSDFPRIPKIMKIYFFSFPRASFQWNLEESIAESIPGSIPAIGLLSIGSPGLKKHRLYFSASRSPPGQGSKRLVFWSSFSQSWDSLESFLGRFSIIWSTLGALWLTFNVKKWIGPPKVAHEAPPRK